MPIKLRLNDRLSNASWSIFALTYQLEFCAKIGTIIEVIHAESMVNFQKIKPFCDPPKSQPEHEVIEKSNRT
jgi:hypothetical protein